MGSFYGPPCPIVFHIRDPFSLGANPLPSVLTACIKEAPMCVMGAQERREDDRYLSHNQAYGAYLLEGQRSRRSIQKKELLNRSLIPVLGIRERQENQ